MARPRLTALTQRQEEALRYIRNLIAHRGIPPTIKDLAEAMRITSSTAFYLLGELKKKGHILRGPQRARSLLPSGEAKLPRLFAQLNRPAERGSNLAPVPILGTAAAGQPILAVEDRRGDVWVDVRITSRGQCFAIEIKGDSMERAGIKNGDMVVARRQQVAQNGDIVVAILGEDATVKELSIQGDHIELRPHNPKHQPILIGPEDELRILGKVVAVASARPPHQTRRT